jgi:hypothetical protein
MAQGSWAGLTVLAAAIVVPNAAGAQPAREARPSTLLTLGGRYTIEAEGCQRSNRSFRVSSRRPIDVGKVQSGQIVSGVFMRERDRAGQAGWRNVSLAPDGMSVEFELFAEGDGRSEIVPGEGRKCAGATPARVVVDVEAWVVDP